SIVSISLNFFSLFLPINEIMKGKITKNFATRGVSRLLLRTISQKSKVIVMSFEVREGAVCVSPWSRVTP
ncbi:MAG: hypothetical protein K2F71_01285, partial [Paramuribaculum sp.]|nr:hypothetical protein [Paramuribaculum sp.]